MNVNDGMVMGRRIMDEFGLQDWRLNLDRSVGRLGYCRYSRKTISLSLPLMQANDASVIENTIRHEVAHALAGPGAGHGPEWKRQCMVTGARPERCTDAANALAPAPWALVCDTCGYSVPRYRRTKKTWTHSRDGGAMIWEREGLS